LTNFQRKCKRGGISVPLGFEMATSKRKLSPKNALTPRWILRDDIEIELVDLVATPYDIMADNPINQQHYLQFNGIIKEILMELIFENQKEF